MVGSQAVNPMTKEELQDRMRETYGSPDKKSRIEGYMQSQAMKSSLSYNDNDSTFGLVTTKP